MPYTIEDYQKDFKERFIKSLTEEDIIRFLKGLEPEELLQWLGPEILLEWFEPEELFQGLDPEEIERYLEKVKGLNHTHLMKPKVYIETTIVSYLTAWPSRDIVIAGHQQITRQWWDSAADRFDLVASQLVIDEASAGNEDAAQARLASLSQIILLDATDEALLLAQQLVHVGAIPEKAAEDAAHIAIAVTNGVEYLVTWNCRHIANAIMRPQIEAVCRNAGYEPTIICTPEELMEPEYGKDFD